MNGFQACTVQQLAHELQRGTDLKLIDVRTPREFQEVHVPQAQNVPLDRLQGDSLSQGAEPLYVICKTGGRASRACGQLAEANVQNLFLVEGGTDAWVAAGQPVVRGKKAISLERQVRIAAGALVLTGVAIGLLLHPAGFALSAFVGAGLVFAGVTDTCGMAMLLAKMPWNSVSSNSKSTSSQEEGQCALPG